jgi:hypothetical protein
MFIFVDMSAKTTNEHGITIPLAFDSAGQTTTWFTIVEPLYAETSISPGIHSIGVNVIFSRKASMCVYYGIEDPFEQVMCPYSDDAITYSFDLDGLEADTEYVIVFDASGWDGGWIQWTEYIRTLSQ